MFSPLGAREQEGCHMGPSSLFTHDLLLLCSVLAGLCEWLQPALSGQALRQRLGAC